MRHTLTVYRWNIQYEQKQLWEYLHSLFAHLLGDKVQCLVGVHQLVSPVDTIKESSALKHTGHKCICRSLFSSLWVFFTNSLKKLLKALTRLLILSIVHPYFLYFSYYLFSLSVQQLYQNPKGMYSFSLSEILKFVFVFSPGESSIKLVQNV